ncbi:unnamed protein product [Cuscuta campestris]|uniref:Uncharacterized protein n=1 Tax=Cuscuta campestris TaxID=132261 RepID=A0A484N5E1_9ASTE|nr:unnamed protein product [Cuscuta campestris]
MGAEDHKACITRFFKIILSWDYYLLKYSKETSCDQNDDGKATGLRKVKQTYNDVDDYISTFEPLIFEEAKAQITRDKSDDDDEGETGWMLGMIMETAELDGFHLPMMLCEESIKQNDLLVISKQKFEVGKTPKSYAFAFVEHRQQEKIKLRMHLNGEYKELNTDKVVKCSRLMSMRPLIRKENQLYVLKVCSLSTIVREYVALWSISSLPFKDLILSATESNSNKGDRAWKISEPLKEFIETNHNKSQLEAINAGLSRNTFVLIQWKGAGQGWGKEG